jgi:hypothetical protein
MTLSLKPLLASVVVLLGGLLNADPLVFETDFGVTTESGYYQAHYASGAMPTVYYSTWQITSQAWQGVRDGAFDANKFYGDFRWETDTGGVILMSFEGYWNEYGNPSISWTHESEQEIDFMSFFFTYPFADYHNSLRNALADYWVNHVE